MKISSQIGILIIFAAVTALSQAGDPMLDVDFLFSDSLSIRDSSDTAKKIVNEYISKKEFLSFRSEYEKEIGRLSREVVRLKNRIALLEEGRRISDDPLATDIVAEQYASALKIYNEGDYQRAGSLFSQVMAETVDNSLRLNATFWAAECAFRLGNYNRSVILLSEIIYNTSFTKLEDGYILLAASYERLEQRAEANKYYLAYIRDFPEGSYAALARKRLGGGD